MRERFDTVERGATAARPTHQSLERGFRVLEAIAARGGNAALADVAAATGLARSTAHYLLQAMVAIGYLRQDGADRRYALSARVMQLAGRTFSVEQVARAAMPLLTRLCRETGESTTLAVLQDGVMTLAAKVDNDVAVRVVQDLGARRPLYCTAVGKALAACFAPSELQALLCRTRLERRTERTIVNRALLAEELRRIRNAGYAVDDEEFTVGVRCIAAPVFDHTRRGIAALGVVGPKQRMTQQLLRGMRAQVIDAASALSRELGYDG